ncbi:MAG: ribbon-helix-helix domain-containing protein [Flammeovirgaceae bacterium]
MATGRPQISVILTTEVKKRLEKISKKESRSLSQMSLILISEALDARDRTNSK